MTEEKMPMNYGRYQEFAIWADINPDKVDFANIKLQRYRRSIKTARETKITQHKHLKFYKILVDEGKIDPRS